MVVRNSSSVCPMDSVSWRPSIVVLPWNDSHSRFSSCWQATKWLNWHETHWRMLLALLLMSVWDSQHFSGNYWYWKKFQDTSAQFCSFFDESTSPCKLRRHLKLGYGWLQDEHIYKNVPCWLARSHVIDYPGMPMFLDSKYWNSLFPSILPVAHFWGHISSQECLSSVPSHWISFKMEVWLCCS